MVPVPIARVVLPGLVAIAAVVAARAAAAPNETASAPLLAYRSGELMELEPLSLLPIRTARLSVPQVTVSWSFAPNRHLVALGGLERLVLFDVGAWRSRLTVRLPGYVVATA